MWREGRGRGLHRGKGLGERGVRFEIAQARYFDWRHTDGGFLPKVAFDRILPSSQRRPSNRIIQHHAAFL